MSGKLIVTLRLHFFEKAATLLAIILFPIRIEAQDYSDPTSNKLISQYLEGIFAEVSDPSAATEAFYAALDKLRKPSAYTEKKVIRLYADVVDIMSDAELSRWKALRTTDEKVTFLKRFWHGHDPTPATPVNERLVEHYTRLLYARDKFTWIDMRGYDDRGMIYIKYGPPDDQIEDLGTNETVPLSSWAYQRYGAPINFDFIDEGFGYRLNGRLTKAIRTTTPLAELFAMQKVVNKRVTLNPTYAQLSMDLEQIIEDEVRRKPQDPRRKDRQITFRQLLDRAVDTYVIEVSKTQAQLPKSTSEVLAKIDALSCALTLAKFQGQGQRLDLVASYGFNPADLKGKSDTLRIQIIAAVRDTTLDIFASRDTTFEFMRRSPQNSEVFMTATYSLPPSKYFFLLDVNNPKGNQRGLRDFSVVLGRYPDGVLHLSTAIFATQVVPASDSLAPKQSLRRHDLAMTPYPFPTIKRDQRIFLYLEIYDLQRDESGETFYEVQYEVNAPEKKGLSSLLASLNPFGKSRGSISVIDTRRGKATTEPTYLQLDFSQLRGGNYNLIVRVTDKVAKITKESRLAFELE
jgi:GWxTD domain-containing protein